VPFTMQEHSRFSKKRVSANWWPRGLSLLALAVCGLLATACDRGDHPARIGAAAPQFSVADDEKAVDLAKLRGQVVVLNFWATSCFPCVEEVPSLRDLQRRMPQIKVVAISNDDDASVYRKFLVDDHVDFLTVRDASSRIPQLYGTIKIPETYVIDRNGVLRRKFVSAQDWTSPEILDYLSKL
jgi:cytochrome c biogenesis protein CcmG/thiol:disulfide interchange protein DsbE